MEIPVSASCMEIPVSASCHRCEHHSDPQRPCPKLLELCIQAQNRTRIDVPCIVNYFLDHPDIRRKNPYSCNEFIAFCLLVMNLNIHLLVPSFTQGFIVDEQGSDEKEYALIKLMSQKVYSKRSPELIELQKEYEKERYVTERKLTELKRKNEQGKSKIEKEIELERLREGLVYINYYKVYNNLKGGSGVIKRVKDDWKDFLVSIALEKGLEWNPLRMDGEFCFWAERKFPYVNKQDN